MLGYLAVVQSDDHSITPILTSDEGDRVAYLFDHRQLAEDFAKNQERIKSWEIIEISEDEIDQWVTDRRAEVTHVCHQLAEEVSRVLTPDEFLAHRKVFRRK